MWDDTNVNFDFKPSGAYEEYVAYSYGDNCANYGVFYSREDGWECKNCGLGILVIHTNNRGLLVSLKRKMSLLLCLI